MPNLGKSKFRNAMTYIVGVRFKKNKVRIRKLKYRGVQCFESLRHGARKIGQQGV